MSRLKPRIPTASALGVHQRLEDLELPSPETHEGRVLKIAAEPWDEDRLRVRITF